MDSDQVIYDNGYSTVNIKMEKFTKVTPYLKYEDGKLCKVLEEGDMGSYISQSIDSSIVDKIKEDAIKDLLIKNKDALVVHIESPNADLLNNTQDYEVIISTLYYKIKEALDEAGIKYSRVDIGTIGSIKYND